MFGLEKKGKGIKCGKQIKWGIIFVFIYLLTFLILTKIFSLREQPGLGLYIGLPLSLYIFPFAFFSYIFKITKNIFDSRMISYSLIAGSIFYFLLGYLIKLLIFRTKNHKLE